MVERRTERKEASKPNFVAKLEARWQKGNFVCVGLDSDFSKIPGHLKGRNRSSVIRTVSSFNYEIVEATHDLVCAYKPNLAFYLAQGNEGAQALHNTVQDIKRIDPDIPVILDAKLADIGNSNVGYAKFGFDYIGADAITVHPLLGGEALEPFLNYKDKGIIVLCRTSNPGAGEFQDQDVWLTDEDQMSFFGGDDDEDLDREEWPPSLPLYQHIAYRISRHWNQNGNCGVVVGATYPEKLAQVRRIVGDMPILIPGIGAQGGELEATVRAGQDSRGWGMIINSSRGIIFASSGPDFAQAARRETEKLRNKINNFRS